MSKEQFALYVNSYREVWDGKKLVISPSIVAKGKDKNFSYFINHNLPSSVKSINETFYEDCIAKCILYLEADKRYGSRKKGDSAPIGDLKKNTVPYTLGLLSLITKDKLDLYKIWLNQKVSKELSNFIYDLMIQVNQYFIDSAPKGMTNYLEWGKKAECWEQFKEGLEKGVFKYDINSISEDMDNPNSPKRKNSVLSEKSESEMIENKTLLESIPISIWKKISEWGERYNQLNEKQLGKIKEIIYELRYRKAIRESLVTSGITIFDIVMKENYELLLEVDEARQAEQNVFDNQRKLLEAVNSVEITLPLIRKMVKFDSERRVLQFRFHKLMEDVSNERIQLDPGLEHGFRINLRKLVERGFVFDL